MAKSCSFPFLCLFKIYLKQIMLYGSIFALPELFLSVFLLFGTAEKNLTLFLWQFKEMRDHFLASLSLANFYLRMKIYIPPSLQVNILLLLLLFLIFMAIILLGLNQCCHIQHFSLLEPMPESASEHCTSTVQSTIIQRKKKKQKTLKENIVSHNSKGLCALPFRHSPN